jgi:hypothetical protein
MSEPEPKLFESRSRSRSENKKFRLHNTGLSNQNMFFTLSLFLIGLTVSLSWFPRAAGEALGVIGRVLVSHYLLSKSNRRNLLVLA